jgi:hypothetical protein
MGCAIASAAMLGGVSYEEAAKRSPYPDAASTRGPHQMHALLEAVTDTEWRLWPAGLPRVRVVDFSSLPWPVAVWIQDAALHSWFGQWIVLDSHIVHDPGEYCAWAWDWYPHRNWFVGRVVEPARALAPSQGIPNPGLISRQHCMLIVNGRPTRVRDLGSRFLAAA